MTPRGLVRGLVCDACVNLSGFDVPSSLFYQGPNLGASSSGWDPQALEEASSAQPSPLAVLACPSPLSAQPWPRPELKMQVTAAEAPRLTSHSQKDRKEQKGTGGLQGAHGGQTCTGHHSPAAGGMQCDVRPSEGGSLRWVVAAGGGDNSRGEGHTDMTPERK